MKLSDKISLRPCRSNNEHLQSEVLMAGIPCGTIVSGRVLEATVQVVPGWLLFITDGFPFEDMLNIHLLDTESRLLDSACIGGPYTTGNFSGLQMEPPGIVHFRFIDEADWHVCILDQPRKAWPWLSDAKGVWRGRKLTRHFKIHRT